MNNCQICIEIVFQQHMPGIMWFSLNFSEVFRMFEGANYLKVPWYKDCKIRGWLEKLKQNEKQYYVRFFFHCCLVLSLYTSSIAAPVC